MENKSSSLTRQVQLWALLGPTIIAVTLIISRVRLSPEGNWLPVLTLLAMPACVRWGFRAFVFTAAILLATSLTGFTLLPVEERFWQVGFTMALMLGLVVTTLCYEEVASLLLQVQVESKSRLENLLRMDEKLHSTQDAWFRDKEELLAENRRILNSLGEKEAVLARYEDMLPTLEQELNAGEARRNDLLKELYEQREEKDQFQKEMEAHKVRVEELQTLYEQKQTERESQLAERVEALEEQLKEVKEARLRENGTWGEKHQETLSLLEMERLRRVSLGEVVEQWEQKGATLRTRWVEGLNQLNQMRCQRFQQQLSGQAPVAPTGSSLSKPFSHLFDELEILRKTVTRWQGMYKQLRDQFRDKSQTLDDTRAQLFVVENERLTLQKELGERDLSFEPEMAEALQKYLINTESQLAFHEDEAEQQRQAYEDVIGALLKELSSKK